MPCQGNDPAQFRYRAAERRSINPVGSPRPTDCKKEFQMLNFLLAYVQTYTKQMRRDDRGATMVEYGLMVALIAMVVVPALLVLGPAIFKLFSDVAAGL